MGDPCLVHEYAALLQESDEDGICGLDVETLDLRDLVGETRLEIDGIDEG